MKICIIAYLHNIRVNRLHTTINKIFLILLFFNITLLARDINIDAIVKKSMQSHKYVFIFLHRTGCGYCENMLMFTLDDDKVKNLMKKKFTYVNINISENDSVTYKHFKGSGHEFAKHVGYNFYPSSLFLDNKDEIIYAIPGYIEEDKFFNILNYIDSGAYKTMEYQTFTHKQAD